MIASWMAYSALVAALLGIVASLLDRALRAMQRPSRFVWIAAMLGTLWLTGSALWTQSGGTGAAVAAAGSTATAAVSTSNAQGGSRLQRVSTFLRTNSPWPASAGPTAAPLDTIDRSLLAAWGAMSGVAFLLLVGSIIRLRRRRQTWSPASVDGTALLLTDGIGPAVVGVVDPAIAVPRWILRCEPMHQLLVIEHERQHILARDPLAILSGLCMTATLPWNPILWVLVRRLRRAIEIDCDRRVLHTLPSPHTYAALLVDIGSRVLPEAALTAALADAPADIERRVADILGLERAINLPGRGIRVAIGVALLVAACVAPKPFVRFGSPAAAAAVALSTPRAAARMQPSVAVDSREVRADPAPSAPANRALAGAPTVSSPSDAPAPPITTAVRSDAPAPAVVDIIDPELAGNDTTLTRTRVLIDSTQSLEVNFAPGVPGGGGRSGAGRGGPAGRVIALPRSAADSAQPARVAPVGMGRGGQAAGPSPTEGVPQPGAAQPAARGGRGGRGAGPALQGGRQGGLPARAGGRGAIPQDVLDSLRQSLQSGPN